MRLRRTAFSLLLLAGTHAARADDAQPGAADVQAQLRAALGPLGGDGAEPGQQVSVTQEGDHLKIAMPFFALMGMTPAAGQDGATTATARMVGGKWDVEDIQSPSPMTFTIKGKDGKEGHMTMTRGDQNGHALFDPTLATPSSMTMIVHKVQSDSVIGDIRQSQRVDSYTSQTGLAPHGDGRLDLDQTVEASSVALAMQLPGKKTLEFAIDHATLAGRFDGLNKDRVGPLIAVTYKVLGAVIAGAGPGKAPAIDPAAAGEFGAALQDIAVGAKLTESADNIRVVADGKRGGADHASFGFGAEAPDGQLAAYVDVSIDGLSLPDTPEAAPYVPKHVAFRPSIAGIDVHTLSELIRSATSPDADSTVLTMQAMGLLASGRLKVGIDTFAFDLGDAKFAGTGVVNVHAPSPQGVDGTARVTAENFDSFVKQMQAQAGKQPEVAKMMPGLIYAKGLAQNDGGKLVWNVAYAGGKLTVNGVDPMPQGAGPQGGKPPSKR